MRFRIAERGLQVRARIPTMSNDEVETIGERRQVLKRNCWDRRLSLVSYRAGKHLSKDQKDVRTSVVQTSGGEGQKCPTARSQECLLPTE